MVLTGDGSHVQVVSYRLLEVMVDRVLLEAGVQVLPKVLR